MPQHYQPPQQPRPPSLCARLVQAILEPVLTVSLVGLACAVAVLTIFAEALDLLPLLRVWWGTE